jgi:hypothetical protein
MSDSKYNKVKNRRGKNMEKKLYTVEQKYTVWVGVKVEASSEEEAVVAAVEKIENGDGEININNAKYDDVFWVTDQYDDNGEAFNGEIFNKSGRLISYDYE